MSYFNNIFKISLVSILSMLISNKFLYSQTKEDSFYLSDSILFYTDFFDQNKAMELILEFDIKTFTKEKSEEYYLPAILTYYIDDTVEIRKSVRIKARGIVRKEYCFFPPYMLNIKDTEFVDDSQSAVNKVKVVSHCKNSDVFNNYLLKEYIIYKIFNMISEYSFKVRLLNIKYIDTGRNKKSYTYLAFMIEPEELLAERLKAYALKMDKMNYSLADTMTTTVMSLFQYMIGNTDYSIMGRHNIKLFSFKDYTKQSIIPVPYDFDFSGLVNAYYAKPQADIGIESVTERYFYGMCRTDDVFNKALAKFREKEDDIFLFINTCEYLDKKTSKYIISYLEEFYKEINKPNFIKAKLRTTCEKFYKITIL